jgi:hypothetical protein
LDGGGNKNQEVQRNQGRASTLTFTGGAVGGVGTTNTVRFGFCQSASHENFSIRDLEILTCVPVTTTSTATTGTTTTNTVLAQLHRELDVLKESVVDGEGVAAELSALVSVVETLELVRHVTSRLVLHRFWPISPRCNLCRGRQIRRFSGCVYVWLDDDLAIRCTTAESILRHLTTT